LPAGPRPSVRISIESPNVLFCVVVPSLTGLRAGVGSAAWMRDARRAAARRREIPAPRPRRVWPHRRPRPRRGPRRAGSPAMAGLAFARAPPWAKISWRASRGHLK
jgi:hypothetical protein